MLVINFRMLQRALGATAATSVTVTSLNEFNVRTYMCVCVYVCVFLCKTKSAVDLNRLFIFFTETSMRASVLHHEKRKSHWWVSRSV